MIINKVSLQNLQLSKNPSRLLDEDNKDFLDMQKNDINFEVAKDFGKNNKGIIVVQVKSEPKNDNAYVFYRAEYYFFVSEVSVKEQQKVIRLIANNYWSLFHADYVSSMIKVNLPTFGFPLKPPENIDEITNKKK